MVAKQSKSKKNVFKVTGNFTKNKKDHPFTKEVLVENKQKAQEFIYSVMGSKHRVKRREISIKKIEEIASSDVTDPIIKQLLEGN
jgi:large subunit ribosomal protein LX